MRELNVAETAEVSGGCCLLLGGLILGALSGFGSSCGGGSFSWGSNCGGFSWGGNWGGNCGGGSYVPAPLKAAVVPAMYPLLPTTAVTQQLAGAVMAVGSVDPSAAF